jgi:hypothetical protein
MTLFFMVFATTIAVATIVAIHRGAYDWRE